MDPHDGPGTAAAAAILIRGPRLVLRALRPEEIEDQWQAMVTADPMTIAELPDEAGFKARLRRSGHLVDGWLDLAIDLDGAPAGRIQTFVPAGRALPPGTFDVGIGLREDMRGRGYGRQALMLLTGWLIGHAAAQVVEAPADPANVACAGSSTGPAGRWPVCDRARPPWRVYRITRPEWEGRRDQRHQPAGRPAQRANSRGTSARRAHVGA